MLTLIQRNETLDFNDKSNKEGLVNTLIPCQSQKSHLTNISNSGEGRIDSIQFSQLSVPSNRAALSRNVSLVTNFRLVVEYSAAAGSLAENPITLGSFYVSSILEAIDIVTLNINNATLTSRPYKFIHPLCQRMDHKVVSKYGLHHDYSSGNWSYSEGVSEEKNPTSDKSLYTKYNVRSVDYCKLDTNPNGSKQAGDTGTSADCQRAVINVEQINFLPFVDLFNMDFDNDTSLALFPINSLSLDINLNSNIVKNGLLHSSKIDGVVKDIKECTLYFSKAPELITEWTNVDVDHLSDENMQIYTQSHPFLNIESDSHPELKSADASYRSQSFNFKNVPSMICIDVRQKLTTVASQKCRAPVSYIPGYCIKNMSLSLGGNNTVLNNVQVYNLIRKNGVKLSYQEFLKTGSPIFLDCSMDISMPSDSYISQATNMAFNFSFDLSGVVHDYVVQTHKMVDSNLEISATGTQEVSSFVWDSKMEKSAVESGGSLQVAGSAIRHRARGGNWWNKVKSFVSGVARGVSNVLASPLVNTVKNVADTVATVTGGNMLKSAGFRIEKRKVK